MPDLSEGLANLRKEIKRQNAEFEVIALQSRGAEDRAEEVGLDLAKSDEWTPDQLQEFMEDVSLGFSGEDYESWDAQSGFVAGLERALEIVTGEEEGA